MIVPHISTSDGGPELFESGTQEANKRETSNNPTMANFFHLIAKSNLLGLLNFSIAQTKKKMIIVRKVAKER